MLKNTKIYKILLLSIIYSIIPTFHCGKDQKNTIKQEAEDHVKTDKKKKNKKQKIKKDRYKEIFLYIKEENKNINISFNTRKNEINIIVNKQKPQKEIQNITIYTNNIKENKEYTIII